MATLVPARRVTLVTEAHLETALFDELKRVGVHGHTSTQISGSGRHSSSDDLMPWNSAVRCEMVVSAEVADKVVDFMHQGRFRAHRLACWVDDTWVDSRDTI